MSTEPGETGPPGVRAEPPAVFPLLPLNDELRWSDMLAALIMTDPRPLSGLLGSRLIPETLTVQREVVVDDTTRVDIVVFQGDQPVVAFELKVLSGLGRDQLSRIQQAQSFAAVQHFVLVSSEKLWIDSGHTAGWATLSWERLLQAHRTSEHPWVSATASAWLAHLEGSLPRVMAATAWNEVPDDEDLVIALRARMSWLHHRLRTEDPLDHDLVSSSAGRSWVVRVFAEAQVPGYQILAEIQERLTVQELSRARLGERPALRGPSLLVTLLQHDVDTSAGFDWEHLRTLWPVMASTDIEWSTRRARPKAEIDRAGHARMVAAGGPPHLGFGFGDAQARRWGACMFGARAHLSPDLTLGAIAEVLAELCPLVQRLAAVEPAA